LSFLDRTNIGNARLAGLEKDLKMKGLDYNIALAVFFPFYVAAEIPSNMMLKKLRPSVWFTIIMIAWAICTTLMGIVKNFHGLLVARMFLGIAEGGLFPGVTFYITMWYRRHECGLRMALFFSAATAAGAFGGLLARGITEMAGIGGRPGWSWIFIIEGLLTFVVACVAYWVINDYPKTQVLL
jgi:MFS family permease